MKEANLSRLIQLEASKHGHRLFRNNVGRWKDADDRIIRYGVGGPGGSDLIGWTRDGRFAAIEVKVGRGRPTELQVAFVAAVCAAGGVGAVVWSVEEAMGVLGAVIAADPGG